MRCSAGFMYANAVIHSCSTCTRQGIFSLMSRLNASTNVIVQSTFNSGLYIIYITSELHQRWVKPLYTYWLFSLIFIIERIYVESSRLI